MTGIVGIDKLRLERYVGSKSYRLDGGLRRHPSLPTDKAE